MIRSRMERHPRRTPAPSAATGRLRRLSLVVAGQRHAYRTAQHTLNGIYDVRPIQAIAILLKAAALEASTAIALASAGPPLTAVATVVAEASGLPAAVVPRSFAAVSWSAVHR